MTEEPLYQTTDGMIDRLREVGARDLADWFEWYKQEIEINEDNVVENLPDAEDSPVFDRRTSTYLMYAVMFGCDLENEYPRPEVQTE